MKKIAICTGATGCVGRNVVEELLLDGWEVMALHRKSSDVSKLKNISVKLIEVDLHDLGSVLANIPDHADAIFHVAGNTSHWKAEAEQQWKDNVLATRNLIEAAIQKKVKRFIFTSTGATIDFQGADETLTNQIPNGYIRTKRLAELEVYKGIKKGLDAVILQPIIVMGAYDYNSYGQIFTGIKLGKIKAAFPGRIAFCHARDVAKAHVQSFYKGRCFENYVLGGEYTSWLDCFQRIAKVVGATPPKSVLPKFPLLILSYVLIFIAYFTRKKPDISPELVYLLGDAPDVSESEKRKAREVLGYNSRSLDEMIKDCHDWLVKERRI